MKTAMLILGIIGAIIGLGGSFATMIGGFGGTAAGVMTENTGTAHSGGFVFWSGVTALVINFVALITSVIGGVAKKKNTILIFAVSTLVCGILAMYLYNWFSGFLIATGGLLGAIGSKEGLDDQKTLKKSPVLYIVSIILLILTATSVLIKNGKSVIESDATKNTETSSSTTEQSVQQTIEVPAAEPVAPAPEQQNEELPFVGKRGFNIMGGSGTEQAITIEANGHTIIETFGTQQTSIDYEGAFTNPIRTSGNSGLFIKDGKIYQITGDVIDTGCSNEGECVSDLTPF
jgi:hypothetical protein